MSETRVAPAEDAAINYQELPSAKTYLVWISKNEKHFAVRILDDGSAVIEGDLSGHEALEIFVREQRNYASSREMARRPLESNSGGGD